MTVSEAIHQRRAVRAFDPAHRLPEGTVEALLRLVMLPADHAIAMFVAIGKAAEPARPRSGQLALDEIVLYDRFAVG